MRIFIKISVFFVTLIYLLINSNTISAHPLDQTYSNIYFNTDNTRNILKPNVIQVEMYISWQQMSYLYEKQSGIKIQADNFDQHVNNFYRDISLQKRYISENLEIKSDDEDCDITTFKQKKYVKEEVLVGKGIGIVMEVTCPVEKIGKISYLNRMFFEDFPYQSHEVSYYSYNKLVLNKTVNAENPIAVYPPTDNNIEADKKQDEGNFLTRAFGKFEKNIAKPSILTFVLLFIIGFFHSLEGGHSKTLILLSTGTSRKKLKDIVGFVSVFVITHIADILLLSFLLFLASPLINTYVLASKIEEYSLLALVFIAFYMLIKNIFGYYKKEEKTDTHHNHNIKNDLAIAFLTGIAPCAMGWTIFALILSSGVSIINVVLYVLTFAFGIASALFAIYFLAVQFSNRILGRFEKLTKLLPIASYLLIFVISLFRLTVLN